MDIIGLRTFIALAETHSFSRAADTLHVTQPAVSKRIAALEQSLGVKLFDRIGKHIQLTEAGAALLPGSRRILEEVDENQRIVSNLQHRIRGKLSMATSHHVGLHRLPDVLKHYIQAFPDVELDIHFLDSEQAVPQILQGEIEFAIVTLPDEPQPQLRHIELWSDPMHCVVAKNHALAKQTKVTHQQLRQQPAILQTTGTHTRKLVDTVFGSKPPATILLETNYLETIKVMVQAGLGWSMLPDSMIDPSLAVLNASKLNIDRHLGVVLHEQRTLSSAANSMLTLLGKQL